MCDRESYIKKLCRTKKFSEKYAQYWVDNFMCEACYSAESCFPHHIISRGAIGIMDEPFNLYALCVNCHYFIHYSGKEKFIEQFPHTAMKINKAREKLSNYLISKQK